MIKHQLQQNEITEGKYFIIEMGKSDNTRKQILHHLLRQRPGLKEVLSVSKCDVILVFCISFSRTGTDIDAALNKLKCSETEFKPAIFMVLHHTFELEKFIEDSSRYVSRMNTLTVDFLFHEDLGLLKCKRNDEALTKIVQPFKLQKQWNLYRIIIFICISSGLLLWYRFFSPKMEWQNERLR